MEAGHPTLPRGCMASMEGHSTSLNLKIASWTYANSLSRAVVEILLDDFRSRLSALQSEYLAVTDAWRYENVAFTPVSQDLVSRTRISHGTSGGGIVL
jgi:hypothetical protein